MENCIETDRKHNRLRAILIEKLHSGDIRIGDRLPSLRVLMRDYGVSYTTASRAIADLARGGYVATRVGYGTVAVRSGESGDGEKGQRAVGLLLCNETPADAYYAHVVHNAQRACWDLARTMSCIALDTRRGDETRAKIEHLAEDTCGFVMAGSFTGSLVEMVSRLGHPVVTVGHSTDGATLPARVDMSIADGRLAGLAATRHLAARGKRMIGLVSKDTDTHWYRQIRRGYDEATSEFGCATCVRVWNDTRPDAEDAARRMLAEERTIDAWVIANPGLFNNVLSALCGRQTPVNMAVIGEFFRGRGLCHPAVRVTWDSGIFERIALRMLLERLEQPLRPTQTVCVPHQVVEIQAEASSVRDAVCAGGGASGREAPLSPGQSGHSPAR